MIRFFEPTNEFVNWLATYAAGRIVVDVGCGDGHLLRKLREKGVRALGIDPRYIWDDESIDVDLAGCIVPMEAQRCSLLRNTPGVLALFCRPCHNGFVYETVKTLHPTAEAVYISKPENIRTDLGDLWWEELEAPPCPEERVYRVSHERRAA